MSTRGTRGSGSQRSDADFQAEIDAHLALEADRLAADGVDPSAARDAAQRAFGNRLAAQERFYESRRSIGLEQLRQDLRYGVRTLWHSRSFFVTAVATLAVGLGLLTVLFAVFNAYVLRPFAIPNPHEIYEIGWRGQGERGVTFSWREYEELAARRDVFQDAVSHRQMLVSTPDHREVYAAFVSGNYFEALGPRVRLGRAVAPFDAHRWDDGPVAVLSDQGWAMLFDRDPNVLGRTLDLNGQLLEVVGVMRPEFSGLDDMPLDVWVPVSMMKTVAGLDVRLSSEPREVRVFGRVRADVSPERAAAALQPFMVRAAEGRAAAEGARPAPRDVVSDLRIRDTPNPLTTELVAMLSPVFAAFGLVLLASCANVSNVMLARAIARRREIGIRLSVGASRGRIIRQLLTEALLVSLAAGAGGLVLAVVVLDAGRRTFMATLPPAMAEMIRVVPLNLDYRVFLFALGVASLTTFVCALLPALQSTRVSLTAALRDESASGIRGSKLRNLLVAGQVTVSLVLLVAAATLVRNGMTLTAVDLGYATDGVLSVNQRQGEELIGSAARTLDADPRVASLAITSRNPLFGPFPTAAVQPAERNETVTSAYVFVSPEYFATLGIPIERGRGFSATEAQAEARVAIVSARAAQTLWPNADPIGRVLRVGATGDIGLTKPARPRPELEGYANVTVVGVAKDVVSQWVYGGIDQAVIYMPIDEASTRAGSLLVRGDRTGELPRHAVQELLERVDRNRARFEVLPLGQMTEIMVYPVRVSSWVGMLLGAIALALSVSGLYGVLMYVLGQRRREIGIRMALGATASAVVAFMMRQSARLVLAGAAAGLVAAFAVLKLLAASVPLANVSLLDGWAFAVGVLLVAAAALVATYFPARRAAQIDPARTLRADA